MDTLKSLIFFSEDVKYLKSLEEIDEFTTREDILKKKIKSNPFNRDLLRFKLNKSSLNKDIKPSLRTINKKQSSYDDNEKNYIKNLTGSTILITTDELYESGRYAGTPIVIKIEKYTDKNELKESHFNNPKLKKLYEEGKIVDITKAEYLEGMKTVWDEKSKFYQMRESSIDDDIYDPSDPTGGSKKSGGFKSVSSVSSQEDSKSIAERVQEGEFYTDTTENTIELSGAERGMGSSLEKQLLEIETSSDDQPMSDSELRNIMGNF